MTAGRTGPFIIIEAIALLERTEKLKGCRQRTHHLLHELRIRRAILVISIHLGDDTVPLVLISDVGLGPQELAVPRLEEVTQILAKFNRDKILHESNDGQHLARITEEAEAEQMPLPEATQVPITVDTPGPSLRVKKEPSALLRDGTNHIETIGLKLRITRDNSSRRCCVATLPLFHIRGGTVWQIAAARRLLAAGSTVGIRPP